MILLIDAYNVLKQAVGRSSVTDRERVAFLQKLKAYGHKKHHEQVVVFDGGSSHLVMQERTKRMVVVYAGAGKSADDYIVWYLNQYQDCDIVLVSSDLELNSVASGYGLVSIESAYFYQLVCDAVSRKSEHKKSTQLSKMSTEKNQELDDIMVAGSVCIPYKDELLPTSNQSKKNTESKENKKLLTILKKL